MVVGPTIPQFESQLWLAKFGHLEQDRQSVGARFFFSKFLNFSLEREIAMLLKML